MSKFVRSKCAGSKARVFIGVLTAALFGALVLAGCGGGGGGFTDSRNGKKYRTVKIGDKVWMAENLNFKTDDSWCHESECSKYGYLYVWNAAKAACPDGWRLPSRDDWVELVRIAGGNEAGTKLKAKSPGWDGTDDFGFSALPGGFYGGVFREVGESGCWWTATELNVDYAYRLDISSNAWTDEKRSPIAMGCSVRCIQE